MKKIMWSSSRIRTTNLCTIFECLIRKGRIMSLAPLFAELPCDATNGIERLLLEDNSDPDVHPINALRRGRRYKMRYTPYKPSLRNARVNHENKSVSTLGKDRFQMSIDMLEFKLNKLSVKGVDQTVTVEGKHGESGDDHDFIQKQVAQGLPLKQ
uniref:SHSP domain-containing protein n=1 Tax=Glossina pallidipes TaxID=7398 RepID=A0A1A9ZR23_GLOPL